MRASQLQESAVATAGQLEGNVHSTLLRGEEGRRGGEREGREREEREGEERRGERGERETGGGAESKWQEGVGWMDSLVVISPWRSILPSFVKKQALAVRPAFTHARQTSPRSRAVRPLWIKLCGTADRDAFCGAATRGQSMAVAEQPP